MKTENQIVSRAECSYFPSKKLKLTSTAFKQMQLSVEMRSSNNNS